MSLEKFVSATVDRLLLEASTETYDGPLTAFHARHLPTISISAYISRIFRYAPCSTECFVTSLVYIHRILEAKGLAFLQIATVHRLLISAVLLASKYLDDIYYNNKFYAKIGGIPPQEMNSLELEMLLALNFDLSVSDREYELLRKQQSSFNGVEVAPLSLLLHSAPNTHCAFPPQQNNQEQDRPQRPTSVF